MGFKINSKQIENLISFGSISYIAGFIIILIHTARIGIPIIEIVKPIYIIVGFPILIVIGLIILCKKFFKLIFRGVQNNFATLKTKLSTLKRNQSESFEFESASDFFDAYFELLILALKLYPFGFLLRKNPTKLRSFFRSKFEKIFIPLSQVSHENEKRFHKINMIIFGILNIILQTFLLLKNILRITVLFVALALSCILYTIKLYPSLPQTVGGGRPITVVMMIDTQKMAPDSNDVIGLFPVHMRKSINSNSAATTKLDILYSTKEQYYIRNLEGKIISFDKSLITAIIWNPK